MGLLTTLFTGHNYAATYSPIDDFWYQKDPRGSSTLAGYPVSADSALRQATVNACVGLISDMVGALPLHLYRRLDDGGKERAVTHPTYTLLHRQPNQRQTPKEWLTMGTQHLLLRGNFYNEIVFDGRFAVAELRPLEPTRVQVTLLDNDRRGYLYRPPKGPQRSFTQDEILHVMGPYSLDNGVTGCGVIEFARESIGAAQAQEGFASMFWRQGAEGHLMLVAPQQMSTQSRAANEKVLIERMAGWWNAHKPLLFEGGLKPERISSTARDSQYNETQIFSAQRLCQFFRVSPDMVGINDGTSQWGTGIEARMLGFLKFTLMPWLIAFQQAIGRDVVDDPSLFAEFLTDALMQADTVARFQSYGVAIMNGIMSENEVRIRENLNPWPGLDEPRRSVNQDRGGTPAPSSEPAPRPRPMPDEEDDQASLRAQQIVREASARLMRKETAAIRKWAPRLASDLAAWREWVTTFYGQHAAVIAETLCVEITEARRYAAAHASVLLERGVSVMAEWELAGAGELAKLTGLAVPASPSPNISITMPDVHVTTPPVNVNIDRGAVQVRHRVRTPDVLVQAPITMQPPQVNVEAPVVNVTTPPVSVTTPAITVEPAVVNVTTPDITVTTPPVTIAEGAVRATINVDAPEITLPPQRGTVKKTVLRDAQGRITGTEEKYGR